MDPDHLGPIPGTTLQQLTSVAPGPDGHMVFLGSLHGRCAAGFGRALAHVTRASPNVVGSLDAADDREPVLLGALGGGPTDLEAPPATDGTDPRVSSAVPGSNQLTRNWPTAWLRSRSTVPPDGR